MTQIVLRRTHVYMDPYVNNGEINDFYSQNLFADCTTNWYLTKKSLQNTRQLQTGIVLAWFLWKSQIRRSLRICPIAHHSHQCIPTPHGCKQHWSDLRLYPSEKSQTLLISTVKADADSPKKLTFNARKVFPTLDNRKQVLSCFNYSENLPCPWTWWTSHESQITCQDSSHWHWHWSIVQSLAAYMYTLISLYKFTVHNISLTLSLTDSEWPVTVSVSKWR